MENQNVTENEISVTATNEPNRRKYGTVDAVAAIVTFIAGFELVNNFDGKLGLTMFLYCVVFAALTVAFTFLKKGRRSTAIVGGAFLSLFSTSFFLFDNSFLKGWSLFFIIVAVPLWYLFIFEKNIPTDADVFLKAVKSVIIIPFGNFGSIFPALGGFSKKSEEKKVGKALLGIAIAFIPTLIIGGFLLDAGDGFSNAFNSLFENFFDDFGTVILKTIFAVPIAMYIFGVIYGNSENPFPNVISDEQCEKCHKAVKKLNGITVFFATLPIMILFAAYIVTEGCDMLTNVVGTAVSTNAVKGFFELCKTSAVSLVFIVLIIVFGKCEGKFNAVKLCTTVISALNLGIVVMAYYKLYLYIDCYGLTLKRVYAAWMITVIAAFFVLLIIKQFSEKFPIMKTAIVTFTVMFTLLCFCNVNKIIASYNINRYLNSNSQEEFDFVTVSETSEGIILLGENYDTFTASDKAEIRFYARNYVERNRDDCDGKSPIREYNIETARAKAVAEDLANRTK